MPKRSSKKNPKPSAQDDDVNRLAKAIVDEATHETVDGPTMTPDGKNAAAVALGRRGGKKGGKARAAKLSAEERSEIARRAAQARWKSGSSEP